MRKTLMAIWLVLALSVPAAAQISEIRIADTTGDWGYPNAFRHYPRGPGYVRMSWVFDTLVWKDENGYVSGLARTWSFDPKILAFAFELHPKAKWHDGRAVTADDVVFTISYFKKHPYGWISLDHVDRAEAKDPHQVVIRLKKPYAPFISDVGGTMPILPRHIWEKVDQPQAFDAPEAFIGSGPYRFKDFNKAQGTYLYEAFADHHLGRPKAERLIYVRSGKPLVSLATGEVDLANIQPEMAEPLRQKGMTIIQDERGWVKKLMINHKKPPFDDRRFRQALAYAINRQEIIERSQRGFGTPASYGLLSLDHEMYNPDTPVYAHDPEKARAMIAGLGYTKSADGILQREGRPLKVELLAAHITVGGQSVADRDGEVIKKQLEAVGLAVDLVNLEQATTDSKVKNWEFDLAVSGHGGISGDARILNEMISSQFGAGSVNSARYDANPELARLLDAQIPEMDAAQRKLLVQRIQVLHAEDLPAIPLYHPQSMAAYHPQKGIQWFFTKGGISKGVPIPQNKMALLR